MYDKMGIKEENMDFQNYFTIQGSALKNVPAGYDKSHPQAE